MVVKGRLVTPRLVGEFIRAYVAEINAANRECGARQATLTLQEQAKLGRQIRNLLGLIQGSAAMVQELRALEQRQEAVAIQLTAAATARSHPNLPHVYRISPPVEAPETALRDPGMAEALRSLINAILVFPSDECGETQLACAAFARRGRPWCGGPAVGKTAKPRLPSGERRSWRSIGFTGCGGTQPLMSNKLPGRTVGCSDGIWGLRVTTLASWVRRNRTHKNHLDLLLTGWMAFRRSGVRLPRWLHQ